MYNIYAYNIYIYMTDDLTTPGPIYYYKFICDGLLILALQPQRPHYLCKNHDSKCTHKINLHDIICWYCPYNKYAFT